MITLELGRIKTWRFPVRSALTMETKASFNTLVRTMFVEGEKEKEGKEKKGP